MEELKKLEAIILKSLSFFEPMSFSKIIFDMDGEVLKNYPQFDKIQMMEILQSLETRGLVKKKGRGENAEWQRIHRHRPFWKRFF